MNAKDAVRALLDRLPDDCSLDDIIDGLFGLEGASRPEWFELTPEQRAELTRRLREVEEGRCRLIPWEEVRRELERNR